MKATDYHMWREIPKSHTRLLHRHLSGTAALEEIKKTLPDWLRDFNRERAEEEGPDYLMMARVASFIDQQINPFVSIITHWEGHFILDQIKHNGKREGFLDAIDAANCLMEMSQKTIGFKERLR
jgi:hypothetical protein